MSLLLHCLFQLMSQTVLLTSERSRAEAPELMLSLQHPVTCWAPSALSVTWPWLQVLSLLDLSPVKRNNRFAARNNFMISTSSFTPDSKLVLVAFQSLTEDAAWDEYIWEARDLTGHKLSEFQISECSTNHAHLANHRVAIATTEAEFVVYDLQTGQSVGSAGPGWEEWDSCDNDEPDPAADRTSPLIAANATGSKVAFCISAAEMHLYDAVSLTTLGWVDIPGGFLDSLRACDYFAWGVHGFQMVVSSVRQEQVVRHACVFRSQPGQNLLKLALHQEVHHDPLESLAISPDSMFCASPGKPKPTGVAIRVYDMRSGQLVKKAQQRFKTEIPGAALTLRECWWGNGGERIMISLTERGLQNGVSMVRQHVVCFIFRL